MRVKFILHLIAFLDLGLHLTEFFSTVRQKNICTLRDDHSCNFSSLLADIIISYISHFFEFLIVVLMKPSQKFFRKGISSDYQFVISIVTIYWIFTKIIPLAVKYYLMMHIPDASGLLLLDCKDCVIQLFQCMVFGIFLCVTFRLLAKRIPQIFDSLLSQRKPKCLYFYDDLNISTKNKQLSYPNIFVYSTSFLVAHMFFSVTRYSLVKYTFQAPEPMISSERLTVKTRNITKYLFSPPYLANLFKKDIFFPIYFNMLNSYQLEAVAASEAHRISSHENSYVLLLYFIEYLIIPVTIQISNIKKGEYHTYRGRRTFFKSIPRAVHLIYPLHRFFRLMRCQIIRNSIFKSDYLVNDLGYNIVDSLSFLSKSLCGNMKHSRYFLPVYSNCPTYQERVFSLALKRGIFTDIVY